ncbi:hypothetical protein F9C28_18045 [Shimwellia pseudoproteus]|uniref:hypothetical protein n=1 Tax=Shimwellia pseudoproteus TaxID=570012 RepID=UPI0018EA4158|nr:hypothetical protein [Shimwellia pseudoproteus]MBJ3816755.1 hypothetical protein [Shimwellia pseudoproteus]
MSTPQRIVEEYVFNKDGLDHAIHGRITVSVGTSQEIWRWETDYVDNSHPEKQVNSAGVARETLFSYIKKFNTKNCEKASCW